MANWIFLRPDTHPVVSAVSAFVPGEKRNCVAAFRRVYHLKEDAKVEIKVSADAIYTLSVNGKRLGAGPASAGGDYGAVCPMPCHYATAYAFPAEKGELVFDATVSLQPLSLCDFSRGHGGFYLSGTAVSEHETVTLGTDETWMAREDRRYVTPYDFCDVSDADAWETVELLPDRWHASVAPIPPMEETVVYEKTLQVPDGDEKYAFTETFDRLYAAYPVIECDGPVLVDLTVFESDGLNETHYTFRADRPSRFVALSFESVGGCRAVLRGTETPVSVKISFLASRYPSPVVGRFLCDDEGINRVYERSLVNVDLCRQTLHLDSPRHREPLGCMGDYYIETLVETFAYGDMTLAKFDLSRIADRLAASNGDSFHTSYTLITVEWIRDVWLYTGDRDFLSNCEKALRAVFARFDGFVGRDGLLATPDYTFLDWLTVDGFSLHHPPKYLGQTAMNCFYVSALKAGIELFRALGDGAFADLLEERENRIKNACVSLLYDAKRGLFFDGIGDDEPEAPWRPANRRARHYGAHANILAVRAGLLGGGSRKLMQTILSENMTAVQPYFTHFLFDALIATDLFDAYGMTLAHRFADVVTEDARGIPEGWYKPDDTYRFDESHAWGATVAYQLPRALLGFSITAPGCAKIRLSPRLYGLRSVLLEVALPQGTLTMKADGGRIVSLDVPDGVTVENASPLPLSRIDG